MDKYEYNVKSDQIKKLYSRKEYAAAAKIADEIDWRKVKDNSMISRVADVYENNKEYGKAKEILLIAYERSPLGRQLAYRLTILSLRTRDFVEADEFYQDFVEMSPMDVAQYILKYRISKAKGEDTDVLIRILEAYVDVEKDERWQYELAKLYHEAGYVDKCVSMCDDIILWFNNGKYVEKALKLKQMHKALTPEQQNKLDKKDTKGIPNISNTDTDKKNEKITEQIPDSDKMVRQPVNDNTLQNIILKGNIREQERTVHGVTGILKGLDNLLENGKTDRIEPVKTEVQGKQTEPAEDFSVVEESVTEEREPVLAVRELSVQEKIDAALAEDTDANAVNAALEAIKAAEQAAIEAQKAAEVAQRLAKEAQLKAQAAEMAALHETMPEPEEDEEEDIYAGLSGEEISQQLEEDDELKGDVEIDSKDVIEIFEFDEKKDGKCSHIGEELTKTAEIDIDEINLQLEKTEQNVYDTANIQAALAMSMEKIMEIEASGVKEARNPFEQKTEDTSEDFRQRDMETLKEAEAEENLLEPIQETAEPESIESVESTMPEDSEKPEQTEFLESVESRIEESEKTDAVQLDISNDPTKVIDREAINRALERQKELFSKVSGEEDYDLEVPMEIDDQIEGQMTIEEVLEEYERRKDAARHTAQMAAAIEAVKAEMEAEEQAMANQELNADNHSEIKSDDSDHSQPEANSDTVGTTENRKEEKSKEIDLQALNKHKIPEAFSNMFGDFLTFEGMEERIADTLNNLINNFVMDGTSRTNNVIITGNNKVGKTTLGLSIIKAANRGRQRSGRKVAKVKATALNKRGVSTAMMQILGTDLIIEQAGNLMPNTLVDLMTVMKSYTEEMLIILEDDKAAIDRILENMPDLKQLFNNRLDIVEFEINDLVKVAKAYAQREHYTIDDIGTLALYAKIDDINGRNQGMTFEEIEEIIDDAIDHANRFTFGKLIGKLRKNKSGMGILTEEDFL